MLTDTCPNILKLLVQQEGARNNINMKSLNTYASRIFQFFIFFWMSSQKYLILALLRADEYAIKIIGKMCMSIYNKITFSVGLNTFPMHFKYVCMLLIILRWWAFMMFNYIYSNKKNLFSLEFSYDFHAYTLLNSQVSI